MGREIMIKELVSALRCLESEELLIFRSADHYSHWYFCLCDADVLTVSCHVLKDSPELLPCTHGRNFFDHTGSVMLLVYSERDYTGGVNLGINRQNHARVASGCPSLVIAHFVGSDDLDGWDGLLRRSNSCRGL